MTGQFRARSSQTLHNHRQQGRQMRRFQLFCLDPAADRSTDAQLIPQRLDQMDNAKLEDMADLKIIQPQRSLAGIRHSNRFIEHNPAKAARQTLQNRLVQLVGPAKTVDRPGFRTAPLGIPYILGKPVIPDHRAILVPPLGHAQIHA